ncbi:microprocessor complex subunit DGCR8 [Papilio machaon]|uniref:microprocessor complex subunit DGCR8 n=1 Tax=Papilio machaon TaxID=76193 RepID=UPI001E6640CF|nr:microprocessor complex subunit DGCR8 [Papilio machaon]XP_045539056.1 microprocessor complex subunit DGCR8 [Papilio machaon]XP_045539057.1 microprocessor complex subunit DGCR8 [Papilio machaon]XP_045539058.1 microprocessor complex subunit DGCR8 [Papilio machaon]
METDSIEIEPQAKRQKTEDQENINETESDFANDNLDFTNKVDNPDKYTNFVTPEELERLQEYKVLDEVKSNDEDSNDEDSESSEGKEDLPDEEIEKMLEEDLPDGFKRTPKPKEKPYVTRQKIVLQEKGVNHFEVLPLDWMMVRHYSGMPIYMHRTTRVCTLSKPYFLGKGNTRRHDIPISAIPCLSYRRALEEEQKQKDIDQKIQEQIRSGAWATNPSQTNSSTIDNQNNDNNEINETIVKKETQLLDIDKVKIERNDDEFTINGNKIEAVEVEIKGIKVRSDAELLARDIKLDENSQDDTMNTDNQLRCPFNGQSNNETLESQGNEEIPLSRQPVVLPGGIVMPPPRVESVNSSWKTQHLTPEQINDYCKRLFKFRTVNIMHFNRWADRRKYTKARKTLQYPTLPEGTKLITIPAQNTGTENGNKTAKRDWVMNMNGRCYLSVFHEYVYRALQKQPVYEFKQLENASTPYQATVYIGGMQYGVGYGSSKRQAKSAAARASIHILIPEMRDQIEPAPTQQEPDFSFFDYVSIEDPRISEFCAATCEPSPHAILRTCLLRNFGAGDRHIHTEMKKLEYQKIELTMKVGKHSATVICKNKKTAKQRASQSILQALHPHVRSWGSLLRLYGSRSVKSCKEKKLEEQQITLLQDKARQNEPNYAVLEKLRNEMLKLRERDEAVVPIGTLLLPADLPPSASDLNHVQL